jgi:hypothetical protein
MGRGRAQFRPFPYFLLGKARFAHSGLYFFRGITYLSVLPFSALKKKVRKNTKKIALDPFSIGKEGLSMSRRSGEAPESAPNPPPSRGGNPKQSKHFGGYG